MKHFLLTLFVIPFVLGTTKKENYEPVVVLELFTSQGCSSCPPADRLLDKVLDERGDAHIIGLSYHVDYWNYIGWKDPFSKEQFSNKQRAYGAKFNSSTIYTPQVVINGKEHFVGSNTSIMDRKLRKYLGETSNHSIAISSVDKKEESITFNYDVSGNIHDLSLSIILVLNEKITEVKRGENRNRTLKNTNIVVSENTFQLNDSDGKGSVLIPEIVGEEDSISLVLVLRSKNLNINTARQIKL